MRSGRLPRRSRASILDSDTTADTVRSAFRAVHRTRGDRAARSADACEDHQRIFERFVSDRSRGARAMGGMGLGLSLVQDIARLHGGEVTVASIVGEGSTFTLKLPPGAAC